MAFSGLNGALTLRKTLDVFLRSQGLVVFELVRYQRGHGDMHWGRKGWRTRSGQASVVFDLEKAALVLVNSMNGFAACIFLGQDVPQRS